MVQDQNQQYKGWSSVDESGTRGNRGCLLIGCGVLVSLSCALIIIGVIMFSTSTLNRTLTQNFPFLQDIIGAGSRQVNGPAALLSPTGDGLPVEMLVENWDLGNISRQATPIYLSLLDEDNGARTTRWELEVATDENSQEHSFAFDAARVYISMGPRLLAVDREDGTVLWETSLSDVVEATCKGCIKSFDQRLVILTADQIIHGLDTASGSLAWQVTLNDDSPISTSSGHVGFVANGGQIVVLDGNVSVPLNKEVRTYNVADGSLTSQIQPACADPDGFFDDQGLGWNSPVLVDQLNGKIVVFVETNLFAPCIQSWDLSSGDLLWESRLPDKAQLPLGTPAGLVDALNGPYFVRGSDSLYFSAEASSNDASLYRVELVNGVIAPLQGVDDYELLPLGEQGNVLVVKAARTRGSEQTELWGIDVQSGSMLWQHVLVTDNLLNVDFGFGDEWTYGLTPSGLVVLELLTDPFRLLAQKLDVSTGQLTIETTSDVYNNHWTGVAWSRDKAYLTIRALYSVDLGTGQTDLTWP